MQLSTTFVIIAPEELLQECANKHESLQFPHQVYPRANEAKNESYLVIETADVDNKTDMYEIVKDMRKFLHSISDKADLVYATKIQADEYLPIGKLPDTDIRWKQRKVLGVNVYDPSHKIFSDFYIDIKICNTATLRNGVTARFEHDIKPFRVGIGYDKNYISKKNLEKFLSGNLKDSIDKIAARARKEGNFIEILNTTQITRKQEQVRRMDPINILSSRPFIR